MVGQKVLQRTEQVRAESPPLLVRISQSTTLQQPRKEAMRQLTRRIIATSLTAEKDHHRLIVCLTQLAQRHLSRCITAA
jgi:hypothetical protein